MSDSDGFSYFLGEKIHLLRQLKPYISYKKGALINILDAAWKQFDDTDKAYYAKKLSEQTSSIDIDIDIVMIAKIKMVTKTPPENGELNPREIYLKEMRLIVLQDPEFVVQCFTKMSAILADGWGRLGDEQRFVYYLRAVENAQNKKKTTTDETVETKPDNSDNRELVNAENDAKENEAPKCKDSEVDDLTSKKETVQTKKTPTAFMFYKKFMRRHLENQDFGKKEDPSQRKMLISSWKKLSDEAKAVYFEKERLARTQPQQK